MNEDTSTSILEDWDASFLDEVIQVEELVLSSSSITQKDPSSSSYLPPPPSHQQQLHFPPPSRADSLIFSPLRELSQRTVDFTGAFTSNGVAAKCATPSTPVRCVCGSDNAKDLEIERLKRELGCASKQLADLEHECFKLKNERNKDDWLTVADSRNEVKVGDFHGSRTANLEHGIPVVAYHGGIQEFSNVKAFDDQIDLHIAKPSCRAIGVQTDIIAGFHLSKKLQDIWGLPSNQKLGRNLISKLFAVCSADINVLFGFISMSCPSKTMESMTVKTSASLALLQSTNPFLSTEAAKVSCFYSALTKTSSGMLQLEVLFESLFDLSSVENVVIVYRSLRILHVLLKHLLTCERKSEGRENFLFDHLQSGNSVDDIFGYATRGRVSAGTDGTYASHMPTGVRPCEAETLCRKGHRAMGPSLLFSFINWIYLFELMHQIVMKSSEEYVRLEAVSIMNVILIRSDAYTEREKFGLIQVLRSVLQLLKKEAGLLVQKEAVHTLYLLLNCPKLVGSFCSSCTVVTSADIANDGENSAAFQGILERLADCIACSGKSLQALELRKNVITLLAFLASSGKSGFKILVNSKLSREANFLTLILQQLVSEIDLEASVYPESAETSRARTLLIRQVLILLNRLVSNPLHSGTVLRLLTNSRDMVSLSMDVANRLSRKEQNLKRSDCITKRMRETEIVDLGRKFKRRVASYLGE